MGRKSPEFLNDMYIVFHFLNFIFDYSKTHLKRPLKKKTKNWFSRPIIAECRSKVLQNALMEHSAILSTFIKLPFVFKTFVLSFFEWLFKTGFTVIVNSAEPDKMLCFAAALHCWSSISGVQS